MHLIKANVGEGPNQGRKKSHLMLPSKREDSFVIVQTAPVTEPAPGVLQELLVNISYLVNFSRHDAFVLDSLAPSTDVHNIHFLVTKLDLQFLSGLHNYKNLIAF